jgi:hypothetical protein
VNKVDFTATATPRPRGGIAIRLPFDPSARWGDKDVHHVTGAVNGCTVRGALTRSVDGDYLELGPAWCRDAPFSLDGPLDVTLYPEGPQLETLAEDIAAALRGEADARRFFESLATFYRTGSSAGSRRRSARKRARGGSRRPSKRSRRARSSATNGRGGRNRSAPVRVAGSLRVRPRARRGGHARVGGGARPASQDEEALRAVPVDPTHDRRAGLRYLTVAVGRDYLDVPPTSGTFDAPYTGVLTTHKRAAVTRVEYLRPRRRRRPGPVRTV